MKKLLCAGVLAVLSSAAMAESASAKYESGFYALGGFGQVSGSGSGGSNAWNLGLGYDINRYMAVEASYDDLWRKNQNTWSNVGLIAGTDNATGLRLAAIGKLPINDSFKLLAGLEELSMNRNRYAPNSAGTPTYGSASVNVAAFEIGGELQFDMRTSLRVTYFQTANITMPVGFPGSNTSQKVSGLMLGVVAKF